MAQFRRVTRRTVLRGAVAGAAALALPGCGGGRRVTGSIVGPSVARGHAVRDGAAGGPASAADAAEVVVVGGGIAGLSAAWRLLGGGVGDVRLLELEDTLGGTAASTVIGGVPCPWGAHYVPRPTRDERALGRLLTEAGVIAGFDAAGRAVPDEAALCRAPQERVFADGAWHEGLFPRDLATADDVAQWARFEAEIASLAARRDAAGRRAFAIPTASSARDADLLALDRQSMAAWLAAHGYTARLVRWEVDYACRDDYGATPDLVSAWAGLHYFASRIAAPGDAAAPFLTWPEGNGRLVAHLARGLGDRARTGAVVTALEPAGERVVVRWRDAVRGTDHATTASRVVLALPRFAARRLLDEGPDPADTFVTSPWVVANVRLDATPASRGYPTCWDNVLLDSESLGYVVATHQTDRAARDTVWTWYLAFAGSDVAAARRGMLAAPWEAWRDRVLADLAPAHEDLAAHVVSVDVMRWAHGMVRPSPGFLWGGVREAAARPRGRVHVAAADLGGLPLFEEAQASGVRAAEEVLSALGRDEETWL
jgi:protoporphyrinogen oxidase